MLSLPANLKGVNIDDSLEKSWKPGRKLLCIVVHRMMLWEVVDY